MCYGVFSEAEYFEGKYILSYGIVMPNNAVIKSITNEKSEIFELVKLLNEYQIEPIHIFDVIDDFLFEKSTRLIKYIE